MEGQVTGSGWLTCRAGLGEGGRVPGATPLENAVRGLQVFHHRRYGFSSNMWDAGCRE